MQASMLTAVLMPIALAVITLGLGLSLTRADFARVLVYPRAVVIGIVCQTLLLPAVGFFIARGFHLSPELAVGLMLLAASPGGPSANLFSHLARGDVALNITLTAVNAVLSLLTLPLIVNSSLAHFMTGDRAVSMQPGKVAQVFVVVLVPVAIGMFVRARRPALARGLERPVRILSAVFLVAVIVGAVLKERAGVISALQQVGLAALLFNLTSMAVGYFLPLLARLPERQAVAIGMEIGIHNGTLAITIASSPTLLASPTMAIPPAIYSLIMFLTAGAFSFVMSRRLRDAAPDPLPPRAGGETS